MILLLVYMIQIAGAIAVGLVLGLIMAAFYI